jgi:hypothetical protein
VVCSGRGIALVRLARFYTWLGREATVPEQPGLGRALAKVAKPLPKDALVMKRLRLAIANDATTER